MKIRFIIALMLFCLLANNVVFAGVLWIDHHDEPAGSVSHDGSGAAGEGHDDHASHCCHIQAHFQTIYSYSRVFSIKQDHSDWEAFSADRLYSLTFSPPTPPPKA